MIFSNRDIFGKKWLNQNPPLNLRVCLAGLLSGSGSSGEALPNGL
jgi:hypothetical protein